MKTLLVLLFTGAAAFAESGGSWTGVITDSMCVTDHSMMKSDGPDSECAKACVKSNPAEYKYILVVGKQSYKLSDQQMPAQYAARKVVVKGTLFANTGVIKVDSIKEAK